MKRMICMLVVSGMLFGLGACGSAPVGQTQPAPKTYQGVSATFVGDSIANGAKLEGEPNYWQIACAALKLDNPVGMGVNGSCYSIKSDFGMDHQPLTTRYQQIPQTDLIFISLGCNDFGRNTPLGTAADQEDISFYGAMNLVITALKNKCPKSRIILLTPIVRHDKQVNDLGLTMQDYIGAIKTVAQAQGLLVMDMYAATADQMPAGVYADQVHPDKFGHQVMGKALQTWLEENIDTVLG